MGGVFMTIELGCENLGAQYPSQMHKNSKREQRDAFFLSVTLN